MLASVIVLTVLALLLFAIAITRKPAGILSALRSAQRQLLAMLIRLPLALLSAGFVTQIVPIDAIAPYIGTSSGWRGILFATLFGAIVPGGPILTFPLALVIWRSGAGEAQMVAFLASWSIFAMHRVFSYELPMMGPKFVALRMASAWMLPPVAAAISFILIALFGS